MHIKNLSAFAAEQWTGSNLCGTLNVRLLKIAKMARCRVHNIHLTAAGPCNHIICSDLSQTSLLPDLWSIWTKHPLKQIQIYFQFFFRASLIRFFVIEVINCILQKQRCVWKHLFDEFEQCQENYHLVARRLLKNNNQFSNDNNQIMTTMIILKRLPRWPLEFSIFIFLDFLGSLGQRHVYICSSCIFI